MKPTELLITAYDGDRSLFATRLTPEKASTVLAGVDENGDAVVGLQSEKETRVFATVTEALLEVVAPVGVA